MKKKRNVTTKLCELNSFHSHKERKKERSSDEQNGLPRSLKMARMCLACRAQKRECHWECNLQVMRLWWDGVCNICKFWSSRTSIKEALWEGAWLLLGSRIVQVVNQVNEKKRNVTTKLCKLNSFHSHKERKKERSDEQNGPHGCCLTAELFKPVY